MSPDKRVLIVLLAVVGLLSCGCLCLPFGAVLSLPVIHRVREAAAKVEAKRAAEAARARKMAARPNVPSAPRSPVVRIPSEAFPVGPPPNLPPSGFSPPGFAPPEFRLPPPPPLGSLPPGERRKLTTNETRGLGALSELQRQMIYRSATFQERMQETLSKQVRSFRERGMDTSHLERMLADRIKRQEESLNRLSESHRITRAELNQIIAEGKRKDW